MRISKFVMVLAAVLMVVVLAGCGGAKKSGKSTVIWWVEDWQAAPANQVKAEFEAKNSDIVIDIELFSWGDMDQQQLIGLQSQTPPDIINSALAWTIPFAIKGLLEPLDSYVAADKVDLSDYWPGALDSNAYNGKLYGLPYRSEGLCLIYNKDMFRKAGLNADKGPSTLAEMRDYAIRLTKDFNGDGVTDQYGIGLIGAEKDNVLMRVLPVIWGFGGDLLNSTWTASAYDRPESIEGIKYYTNLLVVDKASPAGTVTVDGTGARDLFINGTIAMYVSGQYDIETIQTNNPDIDIGIALLPGKTAGNPAPAILGGWNASIAAKSKNKEAAWKFFKYFTSTEPQKYYSATFPGCASALSAPRYQGPLLDTFADQLAYTRPPAPVDSYLEIEEISLQMTQSIMVGQKGADQAIADAVTAINNLLK